MPRGRKRTTTPVETPVTPVDTATADSFAAEQPRDDVPPAVGTSGLVAEELVVLSNSTAAEAPAATGPTDSAPPTTTAAERVPGATTSRGRFRSWVVDTTRGYTRLTDEREQRILLQFAQKPSADVLTAIKGAGFQFLADYEGLNHVWVRRNDFETRLQVEAIEKLIGTVPSRESVPR